VADARDAGAEFVVWPRRVCLGGLRKLAERRAPTSSVPHCRQGLTTHTHHNDVPHLVLQALMHTSYYPLVVASVPVVPQRPQRRRQTHTRTHARTHARTPPLPPPPPQTTPARERGLKPGPSPRPEIGDPGGELASDKGDPGRAIIGTGPTAGAGAGPTDHGDVPMAVLGAPPPIDVLGTTRGGTGAVAITPGTPAAAPAASSYSRSTRPSCTAFCPHPTRRVHVLSANPWSARFCPSRRPIAVGGGLRGVVWGCWWQQQQER
jgi:hypothetical protein